MRIDSQSSDNEVTIVTLGGNDLKVGFDGEMTLSELFAREGINVGSSQTVWVDSDKVEAKDFDNAQLDGGEEIQIIGKKEGGVK